MMEKTGLPKSTTDPIPTKEAGDRGFPGDNSIADRLAAQTAETGRICRAYNKLKKDAK